MSKSAHHKARRAGAAVAGVTAAVLATVGAEAASAAGSPHLTTTTGTIYACYSNTTKALSETTKAKGCKTGFTELSWNARGPQGPQGAKGPQGATGPQGPPGAIADFTTHRSQQVALKSSFTTVAAVRTSALAEYNVTATEAAGRSAGPAAWSCVIALETSFGSGPGFFSSFPAGMAKTATGTVDGGGTGVIFTSPHGSSIVLRCKASTPNVAVYQADLTATQVGSADGTAVKGKPTHPLIHNHFARLRPGLPAARHARSQTHH